MDLRKQLELTRDIIIQEEGKVRGFNEAKRIIDIQIDASVQKHKQWSDQYFVLEIMSEAKEYYSVDSLVLGEGNKVTAMLNQNK